MHEGGTAQGRQACRPSKNVAIIDHATHVDFYSSEMTFVSREVSRRTQKHSVVLVAEPFIPEPSQPSPSATL
jgi:hypothetical protein